MNAPKSPAPGQEIELKLFVDDGAALDAVAKASGGRVQPPVRQTNHFFDTESRALRGKKMALRLRDEDGHFFVTVKGGSSDQKIAGASLSVRPEEEIEIEPLRAAEMLSGTRSPLDAFGAQPPGLITLAAERIGTAPLQYLGAFENERTRVDVHLGEADVVLELDRTKFPGDVVHYEVELEVPAGVDAAAMGAALEALLVKAGVRGRPASGKASRFFSIVGI